MALPKHIAIIMDGNGRWAKKRNLPRAAGHSNGVHTVDAITEACARSGIKALTLYSFSTENWKRSKSEVDILMKLIEQTIKKNIKKVQENNIRFNTIGRIDELPLSLVNVIKNAKEQTSSNTGMILTLALNYGGRQEILDAVKSICGKAGNDKNRLNNLSQEEFEGFLYTKGLPPLDLIIRTSGEMRLSNFLLWQAAYAEFYITDTLWPDFSENELKKAIEEYENRERRFGE